MGKPALERGELWAGDALWLLQELMEPSHFCACRIGAGELGFLRVRQNMIDRDGGLHGRLRYARSNIAALALRRARGRLNFAAGLGSMDARYGVEVQSKLVVLLNGGSQRRWINERRRSRAQGAKGCLSPLQYEHRTK